MNSKSTYSSLLLIMIFTTTSQGGDEELALFEARYPDAVRRLEEVYSQVRGTYKLEQRKGSMANRVESGTFVNDHGFEKVTFDRKMTEKEKDIITTTVYCVGETAAFKLSQTGQGPFKVDGIGETQLERSEYTALFGKYLKAPFAFSGVPMTAILKNPDFRVLRVDRETRDGQSLLRVDCEIAGKFKQQMSLYLDPDASWIIRNVTERSMFTASEIFTEIEYGPLRGGIPVLQRVTVREGDNRTTVCKLGDWSFEPTPMAEFQMMSYGFPDLTTKAKSRSPYLIYALAGTGLAALTGAIVLRRLSHPSMRGEK